MCSGNVTLPQLQNTAWPWQWQALSPPFPVMVEHGHMSILASNTGNFWEILTLVIYRIIEKQDVSSPFWFSCLACEGMMELQSSCGRAGKSKRIFKQPTQSCGHFEPPTSRILKYDSKVTQIMFLRTESTKQQKENKPGNPMGDPGSSYTAWPGKSLQLFLLKWPYSSSVYSSISFLGKSLIVPS